MLNPVILKAIQAMRTREELQEVYDAAHVQWRDIGSRECLKFHIGDTVRFFARRQNWEGVVQRINRSTISVKCPDCTWKVGPAHLELVKKEA